MMMRKSKCIVSSEAHAILCHERSIERGKMGVKCEIYRDSMQNYKKYGIPKAQLIIADVPYNIGKNMYGSNPMWYAGGDNKNGESRLAGKAAFYPDFNFNLYEFFHFASKMLKKEPKERGKAPCMIVFCSFQQIPTMLSAAGKHGFKNYIHLTFRKKSSAQALKANMRIAGATEHALILYRNKLPKFNNNGKMILDWMMWERDEHEKYPKIHPTQKPVCLLKKLIEIFTDEGDIVIDPCCGSASTLRAALELGRPSYGFEIDRNFYTRAKTEMLAENYGEVSMKMEDAATGQQNIFDFPEVMP